MTELPYHLGRAERRGAVLGWRPGQAAAVALGALTLVLGVGAGGALGVVVGLVGAIAGVVVAVVPLHGRGLDEWAPVLASYTARPKGGALCAGASVQESNGGARLCWPDGTSTAVASVRHRGLRALDDEPRAFGDAVASWLRGLGTDGAPRCTVTLLTVSGPGPTLPPIEAWGDPGAACAAFVAMTAQEPVGVAGLLRSAGVDGAVDLGVAELDDLLASRIAPAVGSLLACDTVARWRVVEGPASLHVAFTIVEWPGGAVDEQVLAALCVSRDRRTVAIATRPEELHRARERTARVRTAAMADEALVERGGFLSSPEASRDAARDVERAGELAAGHGSLRVVGAIAIDASDLLELEAAAARLLADATSCGVRLRRCDGDHRRGVLATVPGWCVP